MTVGDPLNPPGAGDDRDRAAASGTPPHSEGPPAGSDGFPGDQHPAPTNEQSQAHATARAGSPAASAGGVTAQPRRSRARAALVSAILGLALVTAGLYLIGAFGVRLYDIATNSWAASTTDIVLATIGAVCLFVAVLLNGWSPWATAVPGVALTGVGVWSVVSVDGAGRVATFVDSAVGRGDRILSGVHILVLVMGLLLLGASAAVTIARSAGRSRGRT